MNSKAQVNLMLLEWLEQGLSKEEIVARLAEACIGWPYVWGAYGQECTPSQRKSYANRTSCPSGESEQILKKCQVCSGKKSKCDGCKYYPSGEKVLDFDCRGFTRWILAQVGILIQGGGATTQWNTTSNWEFRGTIDQYNGGLAVFFQQNGKKMSHTGLLINGEIIHCSGEVKRQALYKKITHFAIPKGLGGDIPVPTIKPTLKRGSRGPYVTLAQTELIAKGYSCGGSGADGIYGKATEEAVKKFQKAAGLGVDGIIGPKTWEALDSGDIKYFKVIIPHLTEPQADNLMQQYPDAEKIEE